MSLSIPCSLEPVKPNQTKPKPKQNKTPKQTTKKCFLQ